MNACSLSLVLWGGLIQLHPVLFRLTPAMQLGLKPGCAIKSAVFQDDQIGRCIDCGIYRS